MKASDLFVRCLENEGVERIFGVPVEENAHFMMSLERSSIDFILTRHEQRAAVMADVHGCLTGEMSSLLVIPIDSLESALLSERLGNIVCPI